MQHLKLIPFPALHRNSLQILRHQRGMTLVEWMISMTIGLILLAGLTTLIAQQSSTQAELEKSSRQIENGRYAMQLLNEDIQMAGYYGEFSNVSVATPTSTNPCSTDPPDIEGLMAFPVQGYDSPGTTTGLLSCINTANHVPGTDILVVRRVEPATLTIAQAASATVYLQSGLTPSGSQFEKKLAPGAPTTAFTLLTQAKPATSAASAVPAEPAALRKFLVHIYFISPCSVMSNESTCRSLDDSGKPIPTLKRMELTAAGSMSTVPLVEGIENMQIDYGIDTIGDDGSPDGQFVATTNEWPKVMALRVHLLARNNESSAGYVDPKTYAMGYNSAAAVQVVTPAASVKSYKRRLFSQLIRVVNPSSRRDS